LFGGMELRINAVSALGLPSHVERKPEFFSDGLDPSLRLSPWHIAHREL
jgi:hypothetical protein